MLAAAVGWTMSGVNRAAVGKLQPVMRTGTAGVTVLEAVGALDHVAVPDTDAVAEREAVVLAETLALALTLRERD